MIFNLIGFSFQPLKVLNMIRENVLYFIYFLELKSIKVMCVYTHRN